MPRSDAAGPATIAQAFIRADRDGRAALIPYAVSGYPDKETSEAICVALIDAGADLLEIGLPFSDPLADGATLQQASRAALDAGATLARSLATVAAVHAARPGIPIVAMGYANQVLGGDRWATIERLAQAGASGLILADLTPDEGRPLEEHARAAGLAIVYLVTPSTSTDRLAAIAERTGGFLYAVSVAGVTGARRSLATGVERFVARVKAMTAVPVAVGFGISTPAHVARLAPIADGVIVASALVDALGPTGRDVDAMIGRVAGLRAATQRQARTRSG
ncbi:MAG: tryptophan synthase subunit alpha [Chloroflexi bacterium]|nr:tryptophan synthase subunit alpha [Chloroflexota bacterium]